MNAVRVDVNPNTADWHRWRAGGIGGSDVPIILGCTPYADATIARLVLQKLELLPATEFLNWAARRGQLLEPKARDLFTRKTGVPVKVGCFQHTAIPQHRASLDGYWYFECPEMVGDMTAAPATAMQTAEFKAPNHEVHKLFGRVVDKLEPVSHLPLHFLWQVQWQLYVTGAKGCWLCSYSTKKGEDRIFHTIPLMPEPMLWGHYMLPPIEQFWNKLNRLRMLIDIEDIDATFRKLFPDQPKEPNLMQIVAAAKVVVKSGIPEKDAST